MICNFFILSSFFIIVGVMEVWSMFRLLQSVLFLIDSVFNALFCLFWWNYRLYQWYKTWRSYNTVSTMQKQNMNGFSIVLKVVICIIILTDLTSFLLSFVWMKCSKIEEVSIWGGREARVQAWGFPRHPK